jgi:hypothetical protein
LRVNHASENNWSHVSLTHLKSKEGDSAMSLTKKLLAATGTIALIATPVVAQTKSSASKLSLSNVKRSAVNNKTESKMGGSTALYVIAALAVVAGIVIFAGNDDDSPTSP